MDTLTAARLQMGLSLSFHMVFAAAGIGLPLLLVIAEGLWLRTGQECYRLLAHKWAKATGILFAVGAVSGTALALELGLLWPKYMELTGAVVGHIFALEGYAFFVEAIFIGLYLYGWDRLSPRAHWACGVVIAVSGLASGFLVVGVNAWMQLPLGFTLHEGRVEVSDPIAIFKQPAWYYMGVHSTLSTYIAVGFAAAAVYARSCWQGNRDAYTRAGLLVSLSVASIASLLQPVSGDALSKFVFQTQPAKFAAMEGQFKTERRAPLRIGGIPDEAEMRTRYALEIPGGLSFLAAHDFSAEVPGLDRVPRDEWPNVEVTHFAFQAMVGCGTTLMLLAAWFWLAYWRRGAGALSSKSLMAALTLAAPLGFIALQAGWFVSEIGRQPWIIHGVLRTSDAVTSSRGVPQMFFLFSVLYLVLAATVLYLLLRLWKRHSSGPSAEPNSA